MRSLQNKPNVQPADGDFTFGRIKDDTGTGDGTPVDEEVYGDFHQFFQKMMYDAGVTPNELPECAYSGFQLNTALSNLIKTISVGNPALAALITSMINSAITSALNVINPNGLITKVVSIGDWNMDTTAGINVAHGLNPQKIRNAYVVIFPDPASALAGLSIPLLCDNAGTVQGSIGGFDATYVELTRLTGGSFDSATYYSATSFNRGFITLTYAP